MNEKEMLEIQFEQEESYSREFGGKDVLYTKDNQVPVKAPRYLKGYDKSIAERKVQESYRNRLAQALINDGVDCEALLNDTESKTVFMNMVDDIIIKKEMSFKIQGLTNRLAAVDLASFCKDGAATNKMYPVINQYKSHNLVKTYYLSVTDTNGVKELRLGEVPVRESSILLV